LISESADQPISKSVDSHSNSFLLLHKTKGLVLRAVKYGDTSLIVSIYTEMFGMQSYIINGVRSSSSRVPYRANLFQPATLLDLVVYHNERASLQRIKEFRWDKVYMDIFRNVHKNTIALFMTELLVKCLTQPEANADLYAFLEDAFIQLDTAEPEVAANFPLYFMLHLAHFFGFRIQDNYGHHSMVLDLQEGYFAEGRPLHPNFLEGELSMITDQLLKTMHPLELSILKLNRGQRHALLEAYISFYQFHQPGMSSMKSMAVLKEIYGG